MKKKMKEGFFKVSDRFEEVRAFAAIRQGLVMMIPLLVIGSIALMLKSLPIPAYQRFINHLLGGKVVEVLTFAHAGVFRSFAILLAVTTSFSYGMMKQKDTQSGWGDAVMLSAISLAGLAAYLGIQYDDFSVSSFGNVNTFSALFVALVSGWMFYRMKEKDLFQLNQRGTETESIYMKAVANIVPAALIVFFFAIVHQVFVAMFGAENLQQLLEKTTGQMFHRIGNNVGSGLIVEFMIHILWFFGIHGSNVMEGVMQQNFVQISDTAIFCKTFQDVFILMGGCGTALSLVAAILIFSKKKNVRNVASLALPTVVFNISEVVVFGLPVILNPVFLIPYLLVPLVNCAVAYAAVASGLVPHVVQEVEWTSPILLSGYRATGSVAGSILQVVCFVIGIFIYLPFLRMFEEQSERQFEKKVRELTAALQEMENRKNITGLTERNDSLGGVARLLADELRDAIKNRELFLMYQPQVRADESCMGAEALMRWIHPIAGFIYPPLIIQLAKEKELLQDLEKFLFDEASRAIGEMEKVITGEFKVSVNITNASLSWEELEQCIEDSVTKYGISRGKLWLEITEQDALVSSMGVMNKLKRLKGQGHKFLIDDFGMGHTSLTYLQTNAFDVVKLDGALTRDVLENERNRDIISSIVYLSQSLKFQIIAEYVETKEQRDMLAELGCDGFQGYYYSKPLLLKDLLVWMKEQQEKEIEV